MAQASLRDSQLRASLFFSCALLWAADGAWTCSVSICDVLQPAECSWLPTACSTQQITRARARGQITQASEGLSYQLILLFISVLSVSRVGTCALPADGVRCL